jgi:hypothetical protein
VVIVTYPADLDSNAGVQELYAALAADSPRNELILNDVIAALEEGRSPILLTERRDHLEYFATRLRCFTRHLVVLQGGVTSKVRRGIVAQLAAIPTPCSSPCPCRGRAHSCSVESFANVGA